MEQNEMNVVESSTHLQTNTNHNTHTNELMVKKDRAFKNWSGYFDEQGIYWLTFDRQNSNINTLDTESLSELDAILDFLIEAWEESKAGKSKQGKNKEGKHKTKGLVIQSGKKNGFIAGADIQQFFDIETEEEALVLINQGQEVFHKLAKLPFATLALIQGFCLGGGLELALACRYRVAVEDLKTKLGLPEVMLGVHPGWGGTVRLPRIIGALKAFDLILTGRTVNPKKAAELGLIDACVPEWDIHRAVLYYLLKTPKVRTAHGMDRIANLGIVRGPLSKWIEAKLEKKVNREHYPAPFIVLDNFARYGVYDEEAFEIEAKSIAALMITEATKNLVHVFFLQEKLKSIHRQNHYKPAHIHVVGAGIMGGDIAAWCALKGITVTLQDKNAEAISSTLQRAKELFRKYLKDPHRIIAATDRLIPDTEGLGISKADFIIEAIIENKIAKENLFQALEKNTNKEAILATNTSTLPLDEIAHSLLESKRLVGTHFFNPVAKMPLIEVIHNEQTPDSLIGKLCGFARSIDKLPLPVKSHPGFLVNRLLLPYLLESMELLEEGVPMAVIDKIAVEFGMPMGPIELADTVGLDICLHALESLSTLQSAQQGEIPQILKKLVDERHLGKKTGQGFYRYKKGKPIKESIDKDYQAPEDCTDRMILRIINEAYACLREKIVENADYLDAGMVFGAGFPPFRGGPIRYSMEEGIGHIVQRLNILRNRYGDRFLPDEGLFNRDA